MTGYKITRDIFNSLPAIDGRMSEMSQEERNEYVKELYKNTKEILQYDIILPVKNSHDDKNEALKGSILNVKLKRKKKPTPHIVLQADLFLEDSLYTMYQNGYLPNLSIETYKQADLTAYVGKKRIIGDHVGSVALLGTSIPGMVLDRKEKGIAEATTVFYQRETNEIKIYKKSKEKETMGLKELKDSILQALATALDTVLIEDEPDTGEPEPEEEMKNKNPIPEKTKGKEEDEEEMKSKDKDKNYEIEEESENFSAELEAKDKEIAELKEKIEKLKDQVISTEFNILATTGKANIEQKEKFARVAKSEGIEFAKDVFSMHNVAPPSGEKIPATPKELEDDNLKKAFKSMGFSDEAYELATKGGK